MLFLYFLFILYIVFIFFEQSDLCLKITNTNHKKNKTFWHPIFDNPIIGGIFLISFIDAAYSYFEFCLKSLNFFGQKIVPYFILITPVHSIGGFLYQPNLNSLLINTGLIITAFWTVKQTDKKTFLKLLIIYVFFTFAAALTSSRAGLLAVLSVFIFIFIHKRFFSPDMPKKEKYTLIMLFVTYIAVFFFNRYSPFVKFAHQGMIGDSSVDQRLMIWLATILLWLKHPFFGTGLETFKFLNDPYQIVSCKILKFPSDIIGNFTWAHNEPIQILEELGIFAFLSIVFMTIFYYIKVLKKEKNIENLLIPSLILVFIVQAGLSWPLRHPALLTLFFIILALADKSRFFTLKGFSKNIFIIILFIVYILSTIYLFPHIKNDVYFTFKIPKTKQIDKKLDLLYKASQDDYLFWIASSRFIYKAVPYYLKITTGINHIPLIKEDIKIIKMTTKDKKEAEKLKKEILQEAKKLEKLHKIWLSEYYLALAYLFDDNLKEAKLHANKAIEMNPNPPYLWNLLHFINVKYASLKTGKPISTFLPSKKEVEEFQKQFRLMTEKIKKDQK
ncbi:O-antigen ligase family protein [Hippea maritima]|nr:O-antigen ligase family protein [Hippea maritima]